MSKSPEQHSTPGPISLQEIASSLEQIMNNNSRSRQERLNAQGLLREIEGMQGNRGHASLLASSAEEKDHATQRIIETFNRFFP